MISKVKHKKHLELDINPTGIGAGLNGFARFAVGLFFDVVLVRNFSVFFRE